ncbi:MAG: SAM-dependent methyltransferase [Burkholderiales bacterium]
MSTKIEPPRRSALEFFDRQFERHREASDYALNPFECAVLPHLSGVLLDLGCGLGNLALAAAERGCRVTALDASASAIADLARRAGARGLALEAHCADLRHYVPARDYDCVVSIGLLMFFACRDARGLLARLREAVRPGGLAAVNVLVEGTTYMEMFDLEAYCLFGRDELGDAFAGWDILLSRHEDFPAPGGTLKRFHTLLSGRPLNAPAASR